MIKRITLLLVILLLCGCENKIDNSVDTKDKEIINDSVEVVEDEQPKEVNPIKIGLFVNGEKKDIVNVKFPTLADIISLECYYTDDNNVISGNFKDVFNHYYGLYEDISEYKIGYRIKFSTTDGEFDNYIYRPRDVESFFNYIQVYLYDDIHQESSWYSHVEEKDYNDNTLLTSIKLTGSVYMDRVSDDVEVTVFSYKDGDIDSDGKYTGNNMYTMIIRRG